MDPTFWIFIAPLVLIGGGLILLGLAVVLGREQWTFDHNLLIVTSRLLGWKSEQQYVDGCLVIARVGVRRQSEGGSSVSWEWQLQLQDSTGQAIRVLHRHADEDSPRALGAWLAAATGWPLREAY